MYHLPRWKVSLWVHRIILKLEVGSLIVMVRNCRDFVINSPCLMTCAGWRVELGHQPVLTALPGRTAAHRGAPNARFAPLVLPRRVDRPSANAVPQARTQASLGRLGAPSALLAQGARERLQREWRTIALPEFVSVWLSLVLRCCWLLL